MNPIERTRQQVDPVGTLGNRPLTVVLATGAFIYGLVMTIRGLDQVSNILLAVLALLWLAAASLTVTVATSPDRAPFTQSTHFAVQLMALGAAVLSVASQWGSNQAVQDDFGPTSLGLLMLALGPYRPAIELASAGVLSAVFIGFVTLLEVPEINTVAPPVAFALVGMTPILALSFAAASYSSSLIDALERWQRRARLTVEKKTRRLRANITQSVQDDRIMILNQEVLPFFSHVLERDTLDDDDRDRARHIANAIRTLMVAEADRTWLEVAAGDDGVSSEMMSRTVVDKMGRAADMVADQRTALRALIVALADEHSFVDGSMKIVITGTKTVSRGVLTASFGPEGTDLRAAFAPYFAVMRVLFSSFTVELSPPTLTLRFSYEQR